MALKSVAILKGDPSMPIVCASTEISKRMFIESFYGPDVEFQKEIGLGYWSVWKDKEQIGWINLVEYVEV
jgi:hypothetical protein